MKNKKEPGMTEAKDTKLVRTYLEQAWRLDDEIKSKIEQLDVLNALAAHTTSALSGMPHAAGHEGSKLEDTIVKIVGLQEEINADVDRLVDLKREIGRLIAQVENRDQRLILELRYLCRKPWDEITVRMNLSERWTFLLHDRALKKMQEIISKTQEKAVECR